MNTIHDTIEHGWLKITFMEALIAQLHIKA